MTGLVPWLLVTAHAGGPTLDGATGLVVVPSADTVPRARVRGSLGLQLLRRFDGLAATGLPVGFAAGISRSIEVGGRVEREELSPATALLRPASAGFHVRVRALDPKRLRPAVAVQASIGGVGPAPLRAGASLIAMMEAPGARIVLAGGPRIREGRGMEAWQGAGFEVAMGPGWILVDQMVAAGSSEVTQAEARGGLRIPIRDRAAAMLWGGGGMRDGSPWAGGGLALQLASVDGRRSDVDGDTVMDRHDRCRFEPEDLDGFEDSDGCPDVDNDGDGVPDLNDPTPDGEPAPTKAEGLQGDTPTLKMRIKPRPMPGPIDPTRRVREVDDANP